MRWIKASKGKPDTWHEKAVRFIHTKAIICAPDIFLPNQPNEMDKIEWLDESIPASLEQEAERLYPYPDPNIVGQYFYKKIKPRIDAERSAHITAARQYMGEIERLRAEARTLKDVRDSLWKCFEDEKKNHIHFADESEKLKSENERMRKALKLARLALQTSYEVTEYPANGETSQDSAIKIIDEALDTNTHG